MHAPSLAVGHKTPEPCLVLADENVYTVFQYKHRIFNMVLSVMVSVELCYSCPVSTIHSLLRYFTANCFDILANAR